MLSVEGDILFVGDSPSFRNLVAESLAAAGRRVVICSRQQAQVLLSVRAFDVLILNWLDEPGKDAEAYRELCCLAPNSQAYLFVGLIPSEAAQQAISTIRKERILPLTVASLMDFGKREVPPE